MIVEDHDKGDELPANGDAEKRRDEILRRLLRTPPQPQSPKSDVPKKRGESQRKAKTPRQRRRERKG